jgi:hypothetical protein
MASLQNVSDTSDYQDEDLADFSVTSITYPTEDNDQKYIDKFLPSKSRQQLNRAKSTSSFIISPHRKSSIIEASTGRKLTRSYSTWNELLSQPVQESNEGTHSLAIQHSQVTTIFDNAFEYIKLLISEPILKASFAYFIASLAVYSPTISNLLGSSDSKHLTCTVVVYFHPSRTVGSMLQALMFVSYSLIFGIGVSILTFFLISRYIGYTNSISIRNLSLESPFIITITLLICSTSLGLISFWKHRVCKQTFNTACSLAAILIISCIIKVYSKMLDSNNPDPSIPWEKITSIIKCVISGCFISVFVCFTVWKKWAKSQLINNILLTKSSIGDTLAILCDTFTSNDSSTEKINLDRKRIADVFKNLKTNLNKLDPALEETMFECFIFGREKEYYLYYDLVASMKRLVAYLGGLRRAVEFKWEMIEYYDKIWDKSKATAHPNSFLTPIEETIYSSNSDDQIDVDPTAVEKPEELIELFLYYLGPSTKSFVFTMKEILNDNLYDEKYIIKNIVRQYSKSLSIAKGLFEKYQKRAIDNLYKQDIVVQSWGQDDKINQEEVAATCGNFSFSITQISTELEIFLSIMNSLLEYNEDPTKSINFLKIWKRGKKQIVDVERDQILTSEAENSQNPTIGFRIWKLTKFTRGVDFQFGFRVGLGALILGSFAFLDSTRHIFNEWRGEWALVTFCIIMNKSLGGTTMTVKWRFLGTFVGAVTAYFIWILFYPNVIIMAILGFIVSLSCFDIILNWKANNAFGRFILLTYNLTVLYSYTMSLNDLPDDGDDWEGGGNPIIWEIAFHRYFGVSFGVLWAIIITMTLLPVTARGRIKEGISVLWLRMGIIWKRGALTKRKDEFQHDRLDGLRGLNDCHTIMTELRTLLKQAPMELRLKGSFPTQVYTELMSGTEGILDAYENINLIVDTDPLLNPVEAIVVDNLKDEIKELQNCVFLIFYMLASAMKLGLPLISDSASTDSAMKKLLIKLADVRKTVESRRLIGKNTGLENADFVLFYSYCLVTNSIVHELEKLMDEVVRLYGKIDEETLELQ